MKKFLIVLLSTAFMSSAMATTLMNCEGDISILRGDNGTFIVSLPSIESKDEVLQPTEYAHLYESISYYLDFHEKDGATLSEKGDGKSYECALPKLTEKP